MTEAKLLSAFLVGLMSSAHCLGMCGGISMALGMNVSGNKFQTLSRLFIHNTGRILCYALLGLLAGAISQAFTAMFQPLALFLRVLSGVMLIAMGLYIAQWWMGLTVLEHAGQQLWQKIQPRLSLFQPATRLRNAFVLGLCWGLLPCGLVYSVLIWTSSAQSATQSAVLMLFFGLGTIPAMLASAFGASQLKKLLQNSSVRVVIALLLCVLGAWTIAQALGHHHQ
jgi:sulfite exporter TauE/SafE